MSLHLSRRSETAKRQMRNWLASLPFGVALMLQSCAADIGPAQPKQFPYRRHITADDVPESQREAFVGLLEVIGGQRIDVGAYAELLPTEHVTHHVDRSGQRWVLPETHDLFCVSDEASLEPRRKPERPKEMRPDSDHPNRAACQTNRESTAELPVKGARS